MRRGSSSRERMLAAAETLLREGGLAAAGIKQLVAESGAPIGSVYHFFPGGKEQVVTEAVERHGARARDLLEGAFAVGGPLPQRIRALFNRAAREFDRAGGTKSCAIGNVTLDLSRSDKRLRRTCAECFESWIRALDPLLPWPEESRRRSFAELLIILLEGAFVLARAQGSGRPFEIAGAWLAGTIEALPEQQERSRS